MNKKGIAQYGGFLIFVVLILGLLFFGGILTFSTIGNLLAKIGTIGWILIIVVVLALLFSGGKRKR